MKDKDKTQGQLIKELTSLRRRIAELEALGLKRNQFEEALRTERDKAQQYLDIAEVMFVVLNKKGEITLINRKGNHILGYKEDELLGKNWFTTCVPSRLRKKIKNGFLKLMAGEVTLTEFYENPILTKSGKEKMMAWHNALLQDIQGNPVGTLSSGEDITDRKQAEEKLRESEERYKTLFDEAVVGICLADAETGIIIDCNEAMAALVGRERRDLIGKPQKILHPAQDNEEAFSPTFKQHLTYKEGLILETQVITKTGDIREVEIKANFLDLQSRKVLQGLFHDITDRKQAEATLRESEQRYRGLFEGAAEGILIADLKLKQFLYANPAMCNMLGYGEEELINLSVRDIHPRESLEHVISEFEAQGRGEKSLAPAIPCVRKDGTILYTDITTSKMLIDGKECNVGFFTDITDRKQAEEALRESETRFRTLFEAIPDTVLVHDDKGVILHINEIGAQRLEWSAKDLIGRNLREIVTSENAASISNHVRETHKVGWSRFETTYVSRSGWRTIAEVYEHPIVFGKKKAILSVARDITERKEVEEKLRASEEKYRDLVESINDIIYAIDEHGIVTYIAPTIESISGYTTSEIIGRSFFDFVYEEDTPSMKDEFQQDISDHPEPHEYRMVTKAGDIRWVRTFSRPFFEGDRIAGLRGVLTDITDRKQVEEALLHEKIFSDTIMDSSPGLFFVFDDKGNILRWNRNAEKFTEYSTQEISKMNVLDFVVPEDTKSAAEAIQEVLNKGQASVEITVLSKSGKKIPFYLTGLRTRIGNITCVVGSGFDITERKQTEEKVWESEERYRAIFEQAADSIVLIDTETGALVEFNNRAHENLGYTREEFEKLKISDVETIESAEEVAKHIEKIVKKGTDIFETKQRTKNGEIRDIQISSKAISIQGRDFLHSIWRDITERKQAEEALQHSYDQLQETFISAINALASTVEMKDQYTAGHQPRVTQLACAIAEEMGLSKNQIEGIRMAGLIHDIGKIVVPAEILNKPGPLTEVQYEMIKMHPQAGHDILKRIAFPWPVAQIVQQHHEMMDGSGYPQGLAGEDILPEARVMAVANVVEAMTAHRPYRPAYDIEEALAEISHNRGAKYDSAVVDACLRLFTERGFVFDSARY